MVISVELVAKYFKPIYALGLAYEKFGVWIKAIPKSLQSWNSWMGLMRRTLELFQIEIGVPDKIQTPNFKLLNSMY